MEKDWPLIAVNFCCAKWLLMANGCLTLPNTKNHKEKDGKKGEEEVF